MCSSNVAYRRSGISSLTRVSTALERVILRNKRRQVHTGPGSMRSMFETPLWRSTVSYVCVYIHVHVRTYIYIYKKYMHIDRTSGGWVAGAVAGRGLFKIPGCTNQPTSVLTCAQIEPIDPTVCSRQRTNSLPAWWKILLLCLAIRARVSISE